MDVILSKAKNLPCNAQMFRLRLNMTIHQMQGDGAVIQASSETARKSIMRIVQKEFGVSTRSRAQMIDITDRVESVVRDSGIAAGEVTVYCPHTTAAITINENADPSVLHDVLLVLDELVPRSNPDYRHNEGNSDAHCKSSLVGCSEHILSQNGHLVLGTWQGIFFCEFDGPRSRRVIVQVRGE